MNQEPLRGKPRDAEAIHRLSTGFMPACVMAAAADLDLFTVLGDQQLAAAELAGRLGSDLRGTTILADALAALDVLEKEGDRYAVPASLRPLLTAGGPQTILPMLQHRANILRGWAQLAWTVKAGVPAPRSSSIRGPVADREAFVAAMHVVSQPVADQLVARLGPPAFRHLLDVGGASGTWTLAFLRARPEAEATIFDLPDAIAQARERVAASEFSGRVHLVSGDFYRDPLPGGADLAWVSAIAHQHSRQHNRRLYGKVFEALQPGGTIAIRDVVMEPDRTRPVQGALFAINMLVATDTGGTFTFEEYAEDLAAAGFTEPRLAVAAPDMNSVVMASRP